MPRGEPLTAYKAKQREEMRARIASEISEMRSQQITITKTSLAEALGVSRQALNAPYIKEILLNFIEFNPSLKVENPSEALESAENEIAELKARLKATAKENKSFKTEIKLLRLQLNESEDRYQHLLGRYQMDIGNKIIHF